MGGVDEVAEIVPVAVDGSAVDGFESGEQVAVVEHVALDGTHIDHDAVESRAARLVEIEVDGVAHGKTFEVGRGVEPQILWFACRRTGAVVAGCSGQCRKNENRSK